MWNPKVACLAPPSGGVLPDEWIKWRTGNINLRETAKSSSPGCFRRRSRTVTRWHTHSQTHRREEVCGCFPDTEWCYSISFPICFGINVAHIWSWNSQSQRSDNARVSVITTPKFTYTAYCTELLQIRLLCLIKTPDSCRHHKDAILWLKANLTGAGT